MLDESCWMYLLRYSSCEAASRTMSLSSETVWWSSASYQEWGVLERMEVGARAVVWWPVEDEE